MKKILIISLLLVGCAHGVSDPVEVEVETKTVPSPRPVPYQPADPPVNESSTEGKDCKVVQTVYADNCVLHVIKCTDGSVHFDSYCFGPPYVPEWKWWHDPVGPLKHGNDNEQ